MNFCLLLLLVLSIAYVDAAKRPYIVAAYEHPRFGGPNDPPSLVIEKNLEIYKRAAKISSKRGAEIIVYPEYGLFCPGNRTMLKDYLEDIPDPTQFHVNPCADIELYSNRPILHTLSCIAKKNSIYVVANTGDIKNCTGDPDCPEDGVYHFNTNVVFDRNGTLLLKYYKENLFLESGMDTFKEPQTPIFNTHFGTFATYICFDISNPRMAEVAKLHNVDAVLFSTMWIDAVPQYVSVAFFQGWAIGNNARLVAANINLPGYSEVGSGVFHGKDGYFAYTYNPDGLSKIVLAQIPYIEEPKGYVMAFNDTHAWEWKNDGADISETCSRSLLGDATDLSKEYRCYDENTEDYTFEKLTNPSGFVSVCHKGMCCSLNYSADSLTEDFYIGVKNGTYNVDDKYISCEENCFLARCDSLGNKTCATFPRTSNTLFHYINMKANFSTQHVYPSVVGSKVRLVSKDEWEYEIVGSSTYESSISLRSIPGISIINVGFKAHCYDRDAIYNKQL